METQESGSLVVFGDDATGSKPEESKPRVTSATSTAGSISQLSSGFASHLAWKSSSRLEIPLSALIVLPGVSDKKEKKKKKPEAERERGENANANAGAREKQERALRKRIWAIET